MSDTPAPKRLKAEDGAAVAASAAEYKIIYWPKLPGRAEPIRLLFEEAGVAYEDTAKTDDAIKDVLAEISKDNLGTAAGPPLLAPPVLEHGDLRISQMPNILMYLAPKFGLAPTGDDLFRLNALALTALDGLSNEVHECHHPICTTLFYEEQKTEALRRSTMYVTNRLPKYLEYFDRVVRSNQAHRATDAPWLLGASMTYADLVLFQCVDGVWHQFTKAMDALHAAGEYPHVFALHKAVKAQPKIAAYLASDRRCPYGNGVWRHYDEIDVLPDPKEKRE